MATFPDTNDGKMLAALASLGVTSANITFDGCHDSGQIEDIQIEGLANPDSVLVDMSLVEQIVGSAGPATEDQKTTLRSFVESIGYHILSRSATDWYNNDGGFGEIEIIPGTGRIYVDMNSRYTSIEPFPEDYSIEVQADG